MDERVSLKNVAPEMTVRFGARNFDTTASDKEVLKGEIHSGKDGEPAMTMRGLSKKHEWCETSEQSQWQDAFWTEQWSGTFRQYLI